MPVARSRLGGHRRRGGRVVAGDHHDPDACLPASPNGLGDLRAHRIGQSDESEEREVDARPLRAPAVARPPAFDARRRARGGRRRPARRRRQRPGLAPRRRVVEHLPASRTDAQTARTASGDPFVSTSDAPDASRWIVVIRRRAESKGNSAIRGATCSASSRSTPTFRASTSSAPSVGSPIATQRPSCDSSRASLQSAAARKSGSARSRLARASAVARQPDTAPAGS